jgi:regulator of replication initiation timing
VTDKKISIVVGEEHVDVLEDVEEDEDRDVRSRSEAVRTIIDEWEELREECEDLRTENERLRDRIMALIDEREERTELVRFVDEEEERRRAPAWTRAKWWLLGRE